MEKRNLAMTETDRIRRQNISTLRTGLGISRHLAQISPGYDEEDMLNALA